MVCLTLFTRVFELLPSFKAIFLQEVQVSACDENRRELWEKIQAAGIPLRSLYGEEGVFRILSAVF